MDEKLLKIVPLTCGDLDPHLIHGSVIPPEFTSQTASRSVQPFVQGSRSYQTDRQTDKPRYFACKNRPQLPNIAASYRCVDPDHLGVSLTVRWLDLSRSTGLPNVKCLNQLASLTEPLEHSVRKFSGSTAVRSQLKPAA